MHADKKSDEIQLCGVNFNFSALTDFEFYHSVY